MDFENGQVVAFFTALRIGTSISFASLALLVYDHLLNFGSEVNLVWRAKKWSFMGVCYLGIRYASILVLILEYFLVRLKDLLRPHSRHCISYLEGQGLFSTMIILLIDGILVFRVWILYARNIKLLYFLLFLLISEWIVVVVIMTIVIRNEEYFIQTGTMDGITVCYFIGPIQGYFKYYAVAMLVFASIMFALSLYKCWSFFHPKNWEQMPVVTMFFRDGLIWYLAVLVVLLTQLILLSNSKSELAAVALDPSVAVHSIAGSRVLLNIKAAIAETEMGYNDEDQTHPIRFGEMRSDTGQMDTELTEFSRD